MNIQEFVNGISNGSFDKTMQKLYGKSDRELLRQKVRYIGAAERFSKMYPKHGDIFVFSAPGRTEIGGNHTDHQHGCVLAAAVNLDIIAFVSLNDENIIRLKSEGHKANEVSLDSLDIIDDEKGSSNAIIRGIASAFRESGIEVGGFDAYTTSDIVSGSGLSSSAAFEILVGTVINELFNDGEMNAVDIAQIGQLAENVYFGKASGLMDQMVCSVGGFVSIDFFNPLKPSVNSVDFDFSGAGFSLCITDTRGSHADLTDEYISVPAEMKTVANALDCEFLREVDEDEFYSKLPELRKTCSDRAILRAAHFFAENNRAVLEAEALETGDTEEFFRLVNESGESSANLLQNLYSSKNPQNQEIPLGIMISKRRLGGSGAVRVHGGGFAGTIQAFVPSYLADYYADEMNSVFGENSCKILNIRALGGVRIKL
ncbi:MAG: galactokinase [Ruminococcus sp.]|nr:galactokinase [Ruminococcus sp.]